MSLNTLRTCGAFLLLLSFCLWSCTTARSDDAVDCCLSTRDARLPRRIVTSFSLQTSDGGCKVPATIFVTRRGFKFCAPFPTESKWVKDLMESLIQRPGISRPRRGRKHKAE